MLRYGTDKPDFVLHCNCRTCRRSSVRAVRRWLASMSPCCPDSQDRPRSFANKLEKYAVRFARRARMGAPGEREVTSPIAKYLSSGKVQDLINKDASRNRCTEFPVRGQTESQDADPIMAAVRVEAGTSWSSSDEHPFRFCSITEAPASRTRRRGQHSIQPQPISMPQGGLEALDTEEPLRHFGVAIRHRLQWAGTILGGNP